MTNHFEPPANSRTRQAFESRSAESAKGKANAGFLKLTLLAVVSALFYGVILWLSQRFEFESPEVDRPIIAVLFWFGCAFAAYWVAIGIASRMKSSSRLVWLIIGASLVFRFVLFFSVPIQEVDIYRYLWDGVVSSQGVSPFRFTPEQVRSRDPTTAKNAELKRLARVIEDDPEIRKALNRVHFGQLPTVYPPTSQAVFCCAALLTPDHSSLAVRIQFMKLFLLVFDLGILILVVQLLRICNLPVGLSIAYGWCPLVIKEIANSGHLDSIAVFLTTFVIYLMARNSVAPSNLSGRAKTGPWLSGRLVLIALILAAAVGAKLYPIVLGPLVFFFALKQFGWKSVVLSSMLFLVATVLILWPMLSTSGDGGKGNSDPNSSVVESIFQNKAITVGKPDDPSAGLKTFFKFWKMNDFMFLIVLENLTPAESSPDHRQVWFSILPEQPRKQLVNAVSRRFSVARSEAPFLLTRAITSMAFAIVALWLAWRAARRGNARDYCESAFLTLAWFWLLCPTQNPWYWLWALPLLPFVRSSAWYAVSGLVMVYYLRFWLGYHYADSFVLNSSYRGIEFYDLVVTWLEFGPWLIWLAVACYWRKGHAARGAKRKRESSRG